MINTILSWRALKKVFLERLESKYGQQEASSQFKVLMAHVLQCKLNQVFLYLDDAPGVGQKERFDEVLDALERGVPIQYILNEAYFLDLNLSLDSAVLIPRPETEELVLKMQEILGSDFQGEITDLGTGSGCIALGLKKLLPKAKLYAMDFSPKALEVANNNSEKHGLAINFYQGDILTGNFKCTEIMVSNPPYIPQRESAEMETWVLDHEPEEALFVPDEDPLLFYRSILEKIIWDGACKQVFFEIHPKYADELTIYCEEKGLKNFEFYPDLSGKIRIFSAKF
ncbi:MAG: peptide chain release factor N(5)-glutamine methyltransferase [Luteibaculum sp.]